VTQPHPVAERYLSRLAEGLATLEPAERQEVVQEIRNHIAEATATGTPLDDVLVALGSADALAKAYSVEMLLHPRRDRRRGSIETTLKVIGLVALGSIPTIVIVSTLGSIGVSFIASGIVVFIVGIWAFVAPLPSWVNLSVHPIWAVLLGPVMLVVGGLALQGLAWYVRLLARAVRAVLPARGHV
jgi:uncharacterized membrane protein